MCLGVSCGPGRQSKFRYKVRTSVSIANGGFQLSGGMTRQIPYLLPSGAIFLMYSIGSLNSSSVGRNVGASCKPCGRTRLTGSRLALGWSRRSTVEMSRGADLRALSGTLCAYEEEWELFERAGGLFVEGGGLEVAAPVEGGTTISPHGRSW